MYAYYENRSVPFQCGINLNFHFPLHLHNQAELVYIIDVEIAEGAGTQIRDGRASFDWFINRMGVLSVTLDYDRANYMDAASDVEVTFDIYANGEFVARDTLTVPGGDDTDSKTYGFFGNDVKNYMFEQGDKIDFEFKWVDNMKPKDEGVFNASLFYTCGDAAPGARFNFIYTVK